MSRCHVGLKYYHIATNVIISVHHLAFACAHGYAGDRGCVARSLGCRESSGAASFEDRQDRKLANTTVFNLVSAAEFIFSSFHARTQPPQHLRPGGD
jgi:hypothetical protein